MSNSSLVTYTKISPNSTNPRNHVIDTITIHHTAGVGSAKTIANIFAKESRQASCNYAIGNDGSIALVVDEANRSWCSSNRANDHRAITIEVSNSAMGGDWPVGDKAMQSLIALCVDICKRNKIEKLNYTGDTTGNMTLHKWFVSTNCPGPYLESKMPWIAEQVNKQLGVVEDKPVVPGGKFSVGDEVKLVAGAKYSNGANIPNWLFDEKLYVRELQDKNVVISTLQTGAITGVVNEAYLVEYKQDKPVVKPADTNVFVPYLVQVTCDVLNVRNGASTSYKINTTVKKGDVFTIVEEKNGWGRLLSGAGWISLDYTKKYVSTSYLVEVTCDVLNVREGAGTSYKIKTAVKKGDVYTIVEEKNGWGKLKSGAGWICLDYTKKL